MLREHNVRRPRQLADVLPVTVAEREKFFPEADFGLGIDGPNL